jgi:DNA-binding GntR family transcriptional regulator
MGMTMTDADTLTRAERLAAEIAESILAGVLAPGARLDEQSLAKRYGVSRTPVREALRQLGTSGLIELRPRRGAAVAHMTSTKLEELFVAMGEIEATCARLSAMSMTPVERRRLEWLHDRMGEMAAEGQTEAYIEANVTFHMAIYAGARNDVLAEFAASLRRRLAPFRRAQFKAAGRLSRSHGEHDTVLKAILRGDAAAAHTAMLHHVSLVEDAFEQLSVRAPTRTGKAR